MQDAAVAKTAALTPAERRRIEEVHDLLARLDRHLGIDYRRGRARRLCPSWSGPGRDRWEARQEQLGAELERLQGEVHALRRRLTEILGE
ncbi:MAG: hypothetical protein ACR2MO_02840 [Acidimicrobiales bacterium]